MKGIVDKIYGRLNRIFSKDRIEKFGIKLSLFDFFIFLMHRNNSRLEHFLIKKKDLIVQKYLYDNYKDFIEGL